MLVEGRFANAFAGLDIKIAALREQIKKVIEPWDRRKLKRPLSRQLRASIECQSEILGAGDNIIDQGGTRIDQHVDPFPSILMEELEIAIIKAEKHLVTSTSALGTEAERKQIRTLQVQWYKAEEKLKKARTNQAFIHGEVLEAADLMTDDKHDQIKERLRTVEGQFSRLQRGLGLAQKVVEDADDDHLELERKLEEKLEERCQAERRFAEVTNELREIKGVIRDQVARDADAELIEKLEKLKVMNRVDGLYSHTSD